MSASKINEASAKVFYFFDAETGNISLSAYKETDPLYENNHILLCERRNGTTNKHESITNILRNVLAQAGVRMMQD